MKWISYDQPLPPFRWMFKKDIPAHLRPMAVRVQFRFETVYIVRDENRRVYYGEGKWADTFDFHLATPGHVIGLRDLTSANSYPWANEWREAMNARIQERLAMDGGPR